MELVQYFAYRGSLHRRKGAARHVIAMVWLCRSPFPEGEGGILLLQKVSTCPQFLAIIRKYTELDHQSFIGLKTHICDCAVYIANESPHPSHSVSFSLIYRS
jgi:hypothetical protein